MAERLEDVLAGVLIAEGAGPGNSIHSWRCDYPDQYGPCDCVRETATQIAAAVRAHLAERAQDVGVREAVAAVVNHQRYQQPRVIADAATAAFLAALEATP